MESREIVHRCPLGSKPSVGLAGQHRSHQLGIELEVGSSNAARQMAGSFANILIARGLQIEGFKLMTEMQGFEQSVQVLARTTL